MNKLIEKHLNRKAKIAVVGASTNSTKYGHKVLKFLLDRGFEAYPINPKYERILGERVYPAVSSLLHKINIVDIVVPPSVGIRVVRQITNLGYKPLVWLQPGAESEEIINFCERNGLPVVHGRCIMQEVLRMQNKDS